MPPAGAWLPQPEECEAGIVLELSDGSWELVAEGTLRLLLRVMESKACPAVGPLVSRRLFITLAVFLCHGEPALHIVSGYAARFPESRDVVA